VWSQCGTSELKPDLVVALSGCSMGEIADFSFEGCSYQTLANNRTGQAGAQEVAALVFQAACNSRPREIAYEFTSQIVDDNLDVFFKAIGIFKTQN